jgi:phage-related holin
LIVVTFLSDLLQAQLLHHLFCKTRVLAVSGKLAFNPTVTNLTKSLDSVLNVPQSTNRRHTAEGVILMEQHGHEGIEGQ